MAFSEFDKHDTPTIQEASERLQQALQGIDNGRTYLEGLSAQAKEAASVASTTKLQSSGELLLRNVVLADQYMLPGQLRAHLGITLDEIAILGNILSGRDEQLLEIPEQTIQKLQAGFNAHELTITHDSDPSMRVHYIEALMVANTNLLSDELAITFMTKHIAPKYYCDNISAALANLERF